MRFALADLTANQIVAAMTITPVTIKIDKSVSLIPNPHPELNTPGTRKQYIGWISR